jgi:hypothetical protein
MNRFVAFALLLGLPAVAAAQQSPVPYPGNEPDGEEVNKPKRVLTPEEKAEKAQRRVCKIQICSVLSSRDLEGADIDCPVVKTWREEDIEDILGGQIDWPWGKARCSTQLKLSRAMLARAAGEDGVKAKLDKHTIHCSLDLKSEGQTYDVKVDIQPEVTFKGGKATAAQIHWDNVEAPMLAYSVIWPGATLDNSVNVLGGQIVKMINEFMGKKCGEVKDQLPMRASVSPAN